MLPLGCCLAALSCASRSDSGLSWWLAAVLAIFGAIAFFGSWEYSTYSEKARKAGSLSVGEQRLLRRNAFIATFYMVLGTFAATAFFTTSFLPWGLLILLACLVATIAWALWWLRQKIVWQKAALSYLARLAGQRSALARGDPRQGSGHLRAGLPTGSWDQRQLVIWGPFGVGNTTLAAAIGTEFAFCGWKVRYVGFDKLVHMAGADDERRRAEKYRLLGLAKNGCLDHRRH